MQPSASDRTLSEGDAAGDKEKRAGERAGGSTVRARDTTERRRSASPLLSPPRLLEEEESGKEGGRWRWRRGHNVICLAWHVCMYMLWYPSKAAWD